MARMFFGKTLLSLSMAAVVSACSPQPRKPPRRTGGRRSIRCPAARPVLPMWFFPWLSYAAIAAMCAVLLAMALWGVTWTLVFAA